MKRVTFTCLGCVLGAALCGSALNATAWRSESLRARALAPLESRFDAAPLAPHDHVTGIVVLGGQIARAREAARLAHLFPDAKLLLTGPAASEVAAVRAQGIAQHRLLLEGQASNTFENALFSKRMARPKPGERWLLVTSAVHMPRAAGTFARVGFPVDPWPVFDTSASADGAWRAIRHEWLGLLAYRLLGRTSELFPAPVASEPAPGRMQAAALPAR